MMRRRFASAAAQWGGAALRQVTPIARRTFIGRVPAISGLCTASPSHLSSVCPRGSADARHIHVVAPARFPNPESAAKRGESEAHPGRSQRDNGETKTKESEAPEAGAGTAADAGLETKSMNRLEENLRALITGQDRRPEFFKQEEEGWKEWQAQKKQERAARKGGADLQDLEKAFGHAGLSLSPPPPLSLPPSLPLSLALSLSLSYKHTHTHTHTHRHREGICACGRRGG